VASLYLHLFSQCQRQLKLYFC